MAETFPSIFPNPSRDFSGESKPMTARTNMESGKIRQRNKFSAELRQYSIVWLFNDFQFGMFQSWVKHKIHNVDFFYLSIPTGGEGLKTVLVRLVEGNYSCDHADVLHWSVKAKIECEDVDLWDEDTFDALLALGDISELENAVAHLSRAVNDPW